MNYPFYLSSNKTIIKIQKKKSFNFYQKTWWIFNIIRKKIKYIFHSRIYFEFSCFYFIKKRILFEKSILFLYRNIKKKKKLFIYFILHICTRVVSRGCARLAPGVFWRAIKLYGAFASTVVLGFSFFPIFLLPLYPPSVYQLSRTLCIYMLP